MAGHDHHEHKHVNLNIRAAFVHVLGDLVQSIGVLIAALIIKFTGFEMADPICTFLFGILVLVSFLYFANIRFTFNNFWSHYD